MLAKEIIMKFKLDEAGMFFTTTDPNVYAEYEIHGPYKHIGFRLTTKRGNYLFKDSGDGITYWAFCGAYEAIILTSVGGVLDLTWKHIS